MTTLKKLESHSLSKDPVFFSKFSKEETKFFILHPFLSSEIKNPTFGGSRLISEQIKFLDNLNYDFCSIQLLDAANFGGILYKAAEKIRKNSYLTTKKPGFLFKISRIRWTLNLLRCLLNDFLAVIDASLDPTANSVLRCSSPTTVIIYNYPFGLKALSNLPKKKPGIHLVLYAHNLEWQFFEDKLGNGYISRLLIWLLKKSELSSMKDATHILCINSKDRDGLIREGVKPEKISLFLPLSKKDAIESKNNSLKLNLGLEDKFIVGFVGTNFEANVVAVRHIIQIAKNLPDDVVFLVIGSVKNAFTKEELLSRNMLFTGYVSDLDSYLAVCDAFINPKTTSDTGTEIKMFDYLKFKKPIISTKMGATGFEKFPHIKKCDIKEMPAQIISLR